METGKIVLPLLVGALVLALGILGFVVYRSGSSSGTVASGEVKHVTAAARERRVPVPQRMPGQ